jgi:TrmH family RNA methyltransferase
MVGMIQITSRHNPKIKHMRALRQRKQREASGLFLVEGIFHVGEALAAGVAEYLCYAPDLLNSPFAYRLIEQAAVGGVPCYSTTAEVLATLAEKQDPQGMLAVARQRRTSLKELNPHNLAWGVALVAPQDPGNVGAILRTVDAVGAGGLLLLDSSVDPYHPSAVRASMGALFWHPLVSASFDEWAQWAQQHAYHIYGTSAHGSVDYRAVAGYERPFILLLGSEREGLSPAQAAVCEQLICLPMRGRVSSLNLAVAAGIMLYTMLDKLGADAG